MSASPPSAAAVASTKRPFEEEPDQPDAKRQALDKSDQTDKEKPVVEAGETPAQPTEEPQVKEEAEVKVETNGHNPSSTPANPILSAVPAGAQPDLKPQPIPTTGSDAPSTGQGPPPHHQRQDESQFLHLRSVITTAEAATVIGKGGENVSQIRRLSGAKCTVSDYSRGAVERILTVSGMVDAVAKAFALIVRTLNQEDLESPSTEQSRSYQLRLLIPQNLIGPIIGKGGGRIREIQNASGARLNASDSTLPLSTERSLSIVGVADAVHIATYYVGQTLIEQLSERFGGPAASAYANRHGQASGVNSGLQVVPYIPQPGGGQYGHPNNYRTQHTATRTPSNPYGVPSYSQGPAQQPHPQQPQPLQPQTPVHYQQPQYQGGYAAAGPHQVPTPHIGHQPQGGLAGPPMQPPLPGQPITQQIFIPNDSVGAIIGKGGQKINEIRQLSGAVVKIAEAAEGSNERLVTITGTQENNQAALFMLYSRLDQERKAR